MRATEFIDFLNRKTISANEIREIYSHLEVREENENKVMVLQEKYKKIRREYRKPLQKQRRKNNDIQKSTT